MPWPPVSTFPITRTDLTPQATTHPAEHNTINESLNDLNNYLANIYLHGAWQPMAFDVSYTGTLFYKKVGNIVTVLVDGVTVQSPAREEVGIFPVGYRPGGVIQRVIGRTLASPGVPTLQMARVDNLGQLTFPAGGTIGTYYFGSFQFGI